MIFKSSQAPVEVGGRFVEAVRHTGPSGHLVAYNISFERAVLHHLARQFPEYGDRLYDLADRLWDQLAIYRQKVLPLKEHTYQMDATLPF